MKEDMKEYDWGIVVLSNGIVKDEGIWKPDELSVMRLEAAASFYNDLRGRGVNTYMIICGGNIHGDKGSPLSDILVPFAHEDYGIDPEDTWAERKSINTWENAKYARPEILERGLESKLSLVTNNIQMERALYCFQEHGLDVEPRSAENLLLDYGKLSLEECQAFEARQDVRRVGFRNKVSLGLYKIPMGPQIVTAITKAQMKLVNGRRFF